MTKTGVKILPGRRLPNLSFLLVGSAGRRCRGRIQSLPELSCFVFLLEHQSGDFIESLVGMSRTNYTPIPRCCEPYPIGEA